MALVVTGQAHHHGQAVGDVQHRVQHGQLLGVVQRRGLAGAAAHDQAVNAGRGVVAHQPAQRAAIDGAARERRDQGNPDALERDV